MPRLASLSGQNRHWSPILHLVYSFSDQLVGLYIPRGFKPSATDPVFQAKMTVNLMTVLVETGTESPTVFFLNELEFEFPSFKPPMGAVDKAGAGN